MQVKPTASSSQNYNRAASVRRPRGNAFNHTNTRYAGQMLWKLGVADFEVQSFWGHTPRSELALGACSDLSESTIQAHFWHLSLLLVASGFRVRTIGESRGRAVRKIDPAEPTRWRLARGVARPANPTLRYPHTTTSRCRQVTRAHPPQRVSPASRGAVPFSLLLADCVTITFFGPAICVSPP